MPSDPSVPAAGTVSERAFFLFYLRGESSAGGMVTVYADRRAPRVPQPTPGLADGWNGTPDWESRGGETDRSRRTLHGQPPGTVSFGAVRTVFRPWNHVDPV